MAHLPLVTFESKISKFPIGGESALGGSVDEVGFSVDGGLDSDWCCDDEVSGRSLDADEDGAPSIVDDVCEGLRGGVVDTESKEHNIH